MDRGQVDRVRQFSRTVTQRVGALSDRFLARDRSLGESRLLWEVGPGAREVRSLRARLDLDSGYLSRLLRALEADGLVTVGADQGDRRVRTVRLTAAGRAERVELDRLSDDVAESILTPLTEAQRQRLVTAMADVERLLVASMVRVTVVDPRHARARHCFRAYFTELGQRFDGGFDPDRSISAAEDELRAPAGLLLVATLHDEPVGCGALKFHPGAPAEVKRMWVSPDVRGLGLGRRLLADLEARASAHGVGALRLETNRTLTEAIALYRSAGYREVAAFNDEPYAHHWFEKRIRSARPLKINTVARQ
jgi:DNA-binding MarR family transcriptional regulator